MTIGYYVHHQGEGHRRRATAVARELSGPVVGLGTGQAPQGWPGEWIALEADDDPPVGDPALADVTAGDVLHWVPRHHPGLAGRSRQIVDWVTTARPALVVVDVSVEVTLLVRLCGVPVVVGAMPGERTDAVNALAYDVAEALLAPWPYAAHPDSGWPSSWWEKTWHVGGISALPGLDRLTSTPTDDRRHVLLLWGSGGEAIGGADLDAAREATPGWRWTVRGGGHPAADDLVADLLAADVVVCHAGQGSVADVARTRRPAVVLAQPRPYEEQDATVRALDRLGLAAVGYGWPLPHRWPELLDRALAIGGDGWAAWEAGGAPRAARLLEDLACRLGPAELVGAGCGP